MSTQIPVTVLTGFAGSGKTTLLNRILKDAQAERLAVIENEFGDVGIDRHLVIGADQEVLEANNGCIDCTVREDLIRSLGKLLESRHRFDRVVLETTGLADPGPVVQILFAHPEIRQAYTLDGIVTMVDACHVLQHLGSSSEAVAQIAFADRIVLNKTDLVTPDELYVVKDRVRRINHIAPVITVTMAAVPVVEVLGIGGFDLNRALKTRPALLEPEHAFKWAGLYRLELGNYTLACASGSDPVISIALVPVITGNPDELSQHAVKADSLFSAGCTTVPNLGRLAVNRQQSLELEGSDRFFCNLSLIRGGWYALYSQRVPVEIGLVLINDAGMERTAVAERSFNVAHEHDEEVGSLSLELYGSLDERRFSQWIGTLLHEQVQDIFRTKGILSFEGRDKRCVLQGVHALLEGTIGEPWGNARRHSRLVFIGRNLDREDLIDRFQVCIA